MGKKSRKNGGGSASKKAARKEKKSVSNKDNWTPTQDIALLDLLLKHGWSDWAGIARSAKSSGALQKTRTQIASHARIWLKNFGGKNGGLVKFINHLRDQKALARLNEDEGDANNGHGSNTPPASVPNNNNADDDDKKFFSSILNVSL